MRVLVLTCALGTLAACGGDVGRGGDADNGGPGAKAGSGANPSGSGGSNGGVEPGNGTGPGDCGAGRGARALRRLSHFEYDNTVADLLGLQAGASERFVADTVVNGYDNNTGALVMNPLLAQQLYETAERLAGEAVKDMGKLVPCAGAGGDEDCAEQFIRDFGKRAFRRPLTDAEAARYLTLHELGSADGGFSGGIELVLTAMLQAPNFIYRAEIGVDDGSGRSALDPYEIATSLAYTLTASTPDATLLAAADAGELKTQDQIAAQAERLIDTPRGKEQLEHFVREWLDLGRLASAPKDAALFPEFTPEVRAAMAEEVDRFVSDVVFAGDGTLRSLLDAPKIFVNDQLATFYGVQLPSALDAQGFGAVEAPDPQRHGVLALGAVMSTYARPDSSSPIHRGKLVRERLLCQIQPPPPPGVIVQPPPFDPSLTVRERFAAHSSKEPCHGCHQRMDPIGLGFEHYDGVGRYRTMEAGRPVDATGEILASEETNLKFDGVAELASALSQSPEVERCFAVQWFRFAYGAAEDGPLACALADMQANFAQNGGSIRELLLSTTRSEHFVAREGGPEPPLEDVPVRDPSTLPGGSSDGGMPVTQSDVKVESRTDSSWDTGACYTVTLTNDSAEPVEWSVPVALTGTINNFWNAMVDGMTGNVTFTGADHNHTVAPGGTASFGYCIAK
jgi:hypothetical protein